MNELFVYLCIFAGLFYFPACVLLMIIAKLRERKSRKDLPQKPVHQPRRGVH